MFVFMQKIGTHVRLGILAMDFSAYVNVVVEGMCTC